MLPSLNNSPSERLNASRSSQAGKMVERGEARRITF
jgi:hypothetical protein